MNARCRIAFVIMLVMAGLILFALATKLAAHQDGELSIETPTPGSKR